MLRFLILTAAALTCGACAGIPDQMMRPVDVAADGATQVPILVATTRQAVPDNPGTMFNGERASTVSYATVTISIPPNATRTVGHVQWPASAPGNPQREFVTAAASYIDKAEFSSAITRAAQAGRTKVLIFVHGFNNRFDEAVFRFAQIVHDSKSQAIPVLYTWPSRGEVALSAYTYDRESANYSRDALEQLLAALSRDPNVAEINIVAHSMGNWVALEALRARSIQMAAAANRDRSSKLKNALLVAPDIDVDVFRSEIQRMGPYRPRIELFVSRDDTALDVSKIIWGGVPRMGDVNVHEEPYRSELARDNIVVFDLTKLRTSGDNAHSRAFDDITDVMTMIEQRLPDEQRSASAQEKRR
ncbi:alpha/beta hydrolase [Bradyrhizobium sp.]|uniref:alpha/beta hydrolase n=1 Tax=Bradyrhizobium sp. TaxID=376 RepID=UPI002B91EF33|nr:alpha/beta fold hydrolase [Bradyrhizobium sp.]HMM92781.1 alpha/beta fold hydrolase [Bradyrhizobium sp.]